MNTKHVERKFALTILILLAGAVSVHAQTSAAQEDKAQLKSDQTALTQEQQKLKTDAAKLKSDRRSGRMAAESPDAERIYKDRQAVKGQKRALAADKPGSLQAGADRAAVKSESKALRAATKREKFDARHGRMAAESKDSYRVYQDHRAIAGEKKDIATDKIDVAADAKK